MDSKAVCVSSEVDSTGSTDALHAVKQDPAVLDAKLVADERSTSSPVSDNSITYEKPVKENGIQNNEAHEALRFEDTVRRQNAAVMSLAPDQFELLLQYAGVLRLERYINHSQPQPECAFCKKNGERSMWYSSHVLKDSRGRVQCPVLRGYRCPACGATGDRAHTIKYCPENRYGDRWSR